MSHFTTSPRLSHREKSLLLRSTFRFTKLDSIANSETMLVNY